MSEVREEYTTENYPSFGKKYNGEKAIISLTSWRARINTVSKTLFSLLKQCPGFHIVLVLSEEEFPKMMDELPDNLKLFVDNELIELMFVYKNYKSFKKVLFTMDKYRDVPVISADDDCIYTCNYAQELYDKWEKNKARNIKYCCGGDNFSSQGPATIYSPIYYDFILKAFHKTKIKNSEDDGFICKLFKSVNKPFLNLGNYYYPFFFHDEIKPLNGSVKNRKWYHQQCIFKK